MLQIERVQDIEVLRQIALLQEREIEKLHDRLTALSVQLAQLTGQDATQAQIEIDLLKDLLAGRPTGHRRARHQPAPHPADQLNHQPHPRCPTAPTPPNHRGRARTYGSLVQMNGLVCDAAHEVEEAGGGVVDGGVGDADLGVA